MLADGAFDSIRDRLSEMDIALNVSARDEKLSGTSEQSRRG